MPAKVNPFEELRKLNEQRKQLEESLKSELSETAEKVQTLIEGFGTTKVVDLLQPVLQQYGYSIQYDGVANESIKGLIEADMEDGAVDMDSTNLKKFCKAHDVDRADVIATLNEYFELEKKERGRSSKWTVAS